MERAMAHVEHCPICRFGEIHEEGGRLEQSGHTYLPTTVRKCGTCGYARYAPALGTRWQAGERAAAPVIPLRRVRRAA
jgi:hypothetical protein